MTTTKKINEAALNAHQHALDFLTAQDVLFQISTHHVPQPALQPIKAILFKFLGFPVKYVLAVIPASNRINYSKLAKLMQTNRRYILLATSNEVRYFTDCDVNAITPFVIKEHVHIIVDEALFRNKNKVLFYAGREDRPIIMSAYEYEKIIRDNLLLYGEFSYSTSSMIAKSA